MALGTDKILGPAGAGMVDDSGELTDACRTKFVADIAALLAAGNENGMGLQLTNPLYVLPTPPIPGPSLILDPLNPKPESLFWFKAEPFALLSLPILTDKEKQFQKLVVNTLYAPLVKMMNLNGKTSLGPIIDPSIVLDMSKFPNLTIPQLPSIMAQIFVQVALANVPTTAPAAKIKLYKDFGIGDFQIPDLISLLTAPPNLAPPAFSIPDIPLPNVPNAGVPSFVLPDLILQIFMIPMNLIGQLLTLITSPGIDPFALLKSILELVVNLILDTLKKLGLLVGLPKLLSATLAVIIKNITGMLLCDVVGSLLGTGLIVKVVSQLTGLT